MFERVVNMSLCRTEDTFLPKFSWSGYFLKNLGRLKKQIFMNFSKEILYQKRIWNFEKLALTCSLQMLLRRTALLNKRLTMQTWNVSEKSSVTVTFLETFSEYSAYQYLWTSIFDTINCILYQIIIKHIETVFHFHQKGF